MRPESWNTREFCLRAANDYNLYMRAVAKLRHRRKVGLTADIYSPRAMRVWAEDVATLQTPKLRVTAVAVRAALAACDPGVELSHPNRF